MCLFINLAKNQNIVCLIFLFFRHKFIYFLYTIFAKVDYNYLSFTLKIVAKIIKMLEMRYLWQKFIMHQTVI